MSDNRKFLVAKRNNDRNKFTLKQNDNVYKPGLKRLGPQTATKNLANDRLKKLRNALIEEVHSGKQSKVVNVTVPKMQQKIAKKRPQKGVTEDATVTKVPRSNIVEATTTHTKTEIGNRLRNTNKVLTNDLNASEAMEWSSTQEDITTVIHTSQPTSSISCSNETGTNLFIVVDTNIFISQMPLIKNIIEMNITGNKKPVIFIPWIVIEELDFIKEDSSNGSLKWKAQQAIRYIETTLANKNKRMMGQTLDEVNEQKNTGKSQDNKIIGCCLQVLEKRGNMILLTDDINLRNKAHINNISVCSHKDIMTKIAMKNSTKMELILEKMTTLCNSVITECALKAYGPACHKMPICQTGQSLQDCIKIFLKYWFPVFQENLMKQFKKAIDDLSAFLAVNKNVKDDSNALNDFVRLCVRICVFLKDVESCKARIESTIRDINNIKGP